MIVRGWTAAGASVLLAGCSSAANRDGEPRAAATATDDAAIARAAASASARVAADVHDGHGPIDPELLERPIALLPGIGAVHMEVTIPALGPAGAIDAATLAEAQRYFDQGLTLLHDFDWIDASRSFHEALRRSPGCLMIGVGLSRAESGLGRKFEARRASELAKLCAASLPPREQRFVLLRAQQLDAMAASGARQKELHAAYKLALEEAIAEFPDEVELRMLRGNAEEPSPGGIGQVAEPASIAWYESVLERVPDHLGAHHCLSHAYENRGDHATALVHGEKFRELAPAIPHAWHMCGHDLPRLGRWDEALAQFQHAEELHAQQEAADHLQPGDDWHRAHNLLLLAYTQLRLSFAGRVDDDLAMETFRQQFATPIFGGRADYTHAALVEAALVLDRREEALARSRQLQRYDQSPASRAAGAALEGEMRLLDGDVAAARVKLEQCDAALIDDDAASGGAGAARSPYRGVRVHRTLLVALIDLHDPGEPGAASGDPKPPATSGEVELLALADEIAANPRFDAWGEGLFRLLRARGVASALGHDDLAAKLGERIARIDPQFWPEFAPRFASELAR